MSNIKVGVIGNGFVGKSIYRTFSTSNEVRVYDNVPERTLNTLRETVVESDILFVCVPTPMSNRDGGIDLSYLQNALKTIRNTLFDNDCEYSDKLIVIKSTVIPGTCRKAIEEYQLNIVFSPEFLTERNAVADSICSNNVIIGIGENTVGYENFMDLYINRFGYGYTVQSMSYESAEMVKYMRNAFFAMKVTFMNEMFRVSLLDQNIDWDDAVSGFAMDGRIGHSHLSVPGHDGMYGYGGTCFPKDINAIINFAKTRGFTPKLLESVDSQNLVYRGIEDWKESVGRAISKNES